MQANRRQDGRWMPVFDRLMRLFSRLDSRHPSTADTAGYTPFCDYPSDPDPTPFLDPRVRALSARLARRDALSRETFERLYRDRFESGRELIIGQAEYGPQHKERFWELFNACAILLEGRPVPRLLEFGSSEFTAFYQALFPTADLHLSDRPVAPDYIGFTREVAARIGGCSAYFAIDLEDGAHAVRTSGLTPGDYDLVVFTEVIEHLDVNPVELIGALLGLLRDDGYLYLTTPNFFRRENLEKMAHFENPQEVYPAPIGNLDGDKSTDGNWDGHHHHREYAAKELLRFTRDAGGYPAAFYFSDCWDTDSQLPVHERANLVLVAGKTTRRSQTTPV